MRYIVVHPIPFHPGKAELGFITRHGAIKFAKTHPNSVIIDKKHNTEDHNGR